jgi:hypothetical protein
MITIDKLRPDLRLALFLALSLCTGAVCHAQQVTASPHQLTVVVERNGRAVNRYEFIVPPQSESNTFKSGRTLAYPVESVVTNGATTTTTLSSGSVDVGLVVDMRSVGADMAAKRLQATYTHLPDGEGPLTLVFRNGQKPRLITVSLDRVVASSSTPVTVESDVTEGYKMRVFLVRADTSKQAP